MPRVVAILLSAVMTCLGAAHAEEKEVGKGFQSVEVFGQLVLVDPPDLLWNYRPCKLHRVDFVAGKTYVLDLMSKQFDTYLRLEAPDGRTLAADDDSGGNLNSRITFTATSGGSYRIIATTFNGQVGEYTLKVRER